MVICVCQLSIFSLRSISNLVSRVKGLGQDHKISVLNLKKRAKKISFSVDYNVPLIPVIAFYKLLQEKGNNVWLNYTKIIFMPIFSQTN